MLSVIKLLLALFSYFEEAARLR